MLSGGTETLPRQLVREARGLWDRSGGSRGCFGEGAPFAPAEPGQEDGEEQVGRRGLHTQATARRRAQNLGAQQRGVEGLALSQG